MTKMTDKQIAAYETKGFKRWTKGSMDRLYINARELGLEVSYYSSGNVSSAKWRGEDVSNSDGRRLLASKVWVDVKTGDLNVKTSFEPYHTASVQTTVEDAARELVSEIEVELAKAEEAMATETTETIERESDEAGRTDVESRRAELVRTAEDFIAARIVLSTGLGLDEDTRRRGVEMIENARDKAVAAIRELPDSEVLAAPTDGNLLVQTYGMR